MLRLISSVTDFEAVEVFWDVDRSWESEFEKDTVGSRLARWDCVGVGGGVIVFDLVDSSEKDFDKLKELLVDAVCIAVDEKLGERETEGDADFVKLFDTS